MTRLLTKMTTYLLKKKKKKETYMNDSVKLQTDMESIGHAEKVGKTLIHFFTHKNNRNSYITLASDSFFWIQYSTGCKKWNFIDLAQHFEAPLHRISCFLIKKSGTGSILYCNPPYLPICSSATLLYLKKCVSRSWPSRDYIRQEWPHQLSLSQVYS